MKVSIVIAAYNVKDTVERAIKSALKQNFPRNDFEIIAVNDGSTDGTLEVLEKYKKEIKIINQKNQGAVKAANAGFKEARGEYVIKLDSDDCFEPDILKDMAEILEKSPSINFVYSDYYESFENEDRKIVSSKNIFNILACGVMYRKDDLKREGFYRKGIKFPEYDLLLKTQGKWKGYRISKPLFWYNRTSKSLTQKKNWVKGAINELKKIYPNKIKEIEKIRKY